MANLEFSIPAHFENAANYLEHALERIGHPRRNYVIRITGMPWETAWSDLVNIGLYRTGADVSEVGSTWISSLVAMNALRPFTSFEINRMGGEGAFLPSAWRSTSIVGGEKVWAIPWLSDARTIYYWRDMLENARVDPTTAFQTFANMEDTLARIQASGVPHPWAVTTRRTHNTLYNIVSWVWGAGGEFVSLDGKRPLFQQPEAIAGFSAYFGLDRYLPAEPRVMNGDLTIKMFLERQTAAIMGGPWFLNHLREQPEVIAKVGIALPPGPPFVGGMNLIIWQHVHPSLERAAVELVQHLATEHIQAEYSQLAGFLPVRLELLAQPPFSTDPYYQMLVAALEHGRSYLPVPRWGLVEERLTGALGDIWNEIRKNPNHGSIEAVVTQQLEPLARRIEMVLAQ